MTYPCVSSTHFGVIDGALQPKPYMQWRHVATAATDSKEKSYPVTGGAYNETLRTLSASWVNTSPVAQAAYVLVTRGPAQFVINARSRAYLELQGGVSFGNTPVPAPVMTPELTRFGAGANTGTWTLPNRADYCMVEDRQGSITMHLSDTKILNPNQGINTQVNLKFISEAWETLPIDGGNGEIETRVMTGGIRLDIYAYPHMP